MLLTARTKRLGAGFLLIASLFGAPAIVSAQVSDSSGEVNWRDHARAIEHREQITGRITEIQKELADVDIELAELGSQLSALSADEGTAAEALMAAQQNARALAIEAYVTGTAAELDSLLLGTASAADLTFMSFLLEEHAETTLEAGRRFGELREEASAAVVDLSAQMDAVRARQEDLASEAARLNSALPAAEHLAFVSAIHAQADESLVRNGRPDPTPQQWEALRLCESTLNYRTATGNGFYGAYQFTIDTWYTVGGKSSPDVASPEEQDARARLLYARRGSQPWPICGRYLP